MNNNEQGDRVFEVYPQVEGICSKDFQLSKEGLTPRQRKKALKQLQDYATYHKKYFMGYQANERPNFSEDIKEFLSYNMNNIGDPFESGQYMLNTKFMERAVLDYYAELWHAKWPHLPHKNNMSNFYKKARAESYWGYIFSMGSTEGNIYGLRNARDYLSGKLLALDSRDEEQSEGLAIENENAYIPVLFYSEDTHYSIDKIKDILNIKAFDEMGQIYSNKSGEKCPINNGEWCERVPSNEDGSVNISALKKLVEFFAKKGHPIIVCFNYGTTFKGAYDNIAEAVRELEGILRKYKLYERIVEVKLKNNKVIKSKRNGFWFHVDGALGAAYMPFLEMAKNRGEAIPEDIPLFDFRLSIHSITMSGHKHIGIPWPCGLLMTKTKYLLNFNKVSYIGAQDSTFSGSRNALTPVIIWNYLSQHSYDDQIQKTLKMQKCAQYVFERLKVLDNELGGKLEVKRSPLSLTIRFKKPNKYIVSKYSLSVVEHLDMVHIFTMEHVTEELVDELIKDLSEPDAFGEEIKNSISPEVEEFDIAYGVG